MAKHLHQNLDHLTFEVDRFRIVSNRYYNIAVSRQIRNGIRVETEKLLLRFRCMVRCSSP